MTTRLLTSLALVSILCALPAPATAEPYWYAYEGNDFPENEGWERMWGNWDGPYEGDGAIRTVADGILTSDSRFDTGVYDYTFVERPAQTDPGPGELFVMEWRALIEEEVGEPTWDSAAWIASDDGWQVVIGLRPNEIVSAYEHVYVPIGPGVFHDYRLTSSDMRSYELYIDGDLVRAGNFWEGLTESRLWWGSMTKGVSSLSHWDYVRVGVVPEPAPVWLLAAGLLACALRTTCSSVRRVVGIPVLACILAATATAEPYWIAYEGNDFPENEGWDRHWGNREGVHQGGAIRTIDDGVLTLDTLYDEGAYDFAKLVLPGQFTPGPRETFVVEWRVLVDETLGDHYDADVSIGSDDGWLLGFGIFTDHLVNIWDDDVSIPITPGVFHDYRILSTDMRAYALFIDDELAREGSFTQRISGSYIGWGNVVSGASSRSQWDCVRFGIVAEPCSISIFLVLSAFFTRRRT